MIYTLLAVAIWGAGSIAVGFIAADTWQRRGQILDALLGRQRSE